MGKMKKTEGELADWEGIPVEIRVGEDGTRYVEHQGVRYESVQFPAPGTEVEIDTYNYIEQACGSADFRWVTETAPGYKLVRVNRKA